MTVDSFDPSAIGIPLSEEEIRALCDLAHRLSGDELHLSAAEVQRFMPLATHAGWSEVAVNLSDEDVSALIRLFTLAEMQYSSWAAGDKSPVIPLVRVLKARGVYDVSMTRWIKAHSNNKFLPHGSLLDRL